MRTPSPIKRSSRAVGTLPVDAAVALQGATITSQSPLSFCTPEGQWCDAISLSVDWPAANWIHRCDGTIRLRVEVVDGTLSVLALGEPGTSAIDEVRLGAANRPVDIELVCMPLAACRSIVFRNGGGPSSCRATVHTIDYAEIGPSDTGDVLKSPDDLRLKAVAGWSRYYGDAPSTLAERRRIVRYRLTDRVKPMPWLEDLVVLIQPNDDLSRALYVSGLYEPSTMLALRRLLARGATFIDVGANAGLFSLIASRWVGRSGRVYSFEPSAREFGRLIDHVTLNRLSNIVPVHSAVTSSPGTARLQVAPFPNAGHNTLGSSFAYPTVAAVRTETVTTTSLDRFAAEARLSRIDVIKMDVEGSEHAALAGATEVLRRFRPALIVEISRSALAGCGNSPEQILELLGSARYKAYRIGDSAELIPLRDDDVGAETNLAALPVEHRHRHSSPVKGKVG